LRKRAGKRKSERGVHARERGTRETAAEIVGDFNKRARGGKREREEEIEASHAVMF